MKIGIMQPYFFPYLGYFHLINNVDLFIVYDVVQYVRRGWINRNRILHQNKVGWQYIVLPVVKDNQKTPIRDILLSSETNWRNKILGQLSHYRNTAIYGDETIKFVSDCLDISVESLSHANVDILEKCANLLGINFQYRYCSELNIELEPTENAENKIINLCEFWGAKEYVNLPGGRHLYNAENFEIRGIKLTFLDFPTFEYSTGDYAFEPDLSIIDILMWNSPDNIKQHLHKHRIP